MVKIESTLGRRKSEIKINNLVALCSPRAKVPSLNHQSGSEFQNQIQKPIFLGTKIQKKALNFKPTLFPANTSLLKKVRVLILTP